MIPRVLSSFGVELDKTRNEIVSILKQGQEKSNPVLSKIKSAMVQGEIVLAGRQVALTKRAKKVIELAAEQARLLGHQYIGTEHLLLGVIREGEGLAVGVLESLGIDLGKLRTKTLQILNEQQTETPSEDVKPHLEENEQGIKCVVCGTFNSHTNNYCIRCHERLL